MFGSIGSPTNFYDGLILWASNNEVSGNSKDLSGNRFDGTTTAITYQQPASFGYSFDHNGTTSRTIWTQSALLTKVKAFTTFTMMARARVLYDGGAYHNIFGWGTEADLEDGTGFFFRTGMGGNKLDFWWNTSTLISGDASGVNDGDEVMVLFESRSSTDHELWLDNVSVGTSTTSKTVTSTTDVVSMGASNNVPEELYEDRIMEVMLWDRTWTDAQKTELFNELR